MFKPMLCEKATLEDAQQMDDMVVEQKLDGVRAYIRGGRLYDRRGADITARFGEFSGLDVLKGIFDGEIVAQTGIFEDVAGRMHLKDKFLQKLSMQKSPAVFVTFDWLENGLDLMPLQPRKERLAAMQFPSWMRLVPSFPSVAEGWAAVQQNGWEGLVVKRLGSIYEFRRSKAWLKVKAFAEVEAEFVKFEDHPRGLTLEAADGKRIVVNGMQANYVRDVLQKNGKVRCNVQYLPQKGSDAWRFPSFRGVVDGN